MNLNPIKVRIVKQGAIDLGRTPYELAVSYRSEEVILATLDCRSKYGEVSFATSDPPGLWLSATETTLHLKKGHARESDTKIELPDLLDWEIYLAAWQGRYSLSLCLRRVKQVEG